MCDDRTINTRTRHDVFSIPNDHFVSLTMRNPIIGLVACVAIASVSHSASGQASGVVTCENLGVDLSAVGTDVPTLYRLGLDDAQATDAAVALSAFSAPTSHLPPLIAGLAADAEAGADDRWWFQPTLSLWAPGIHGDIGVRRLTAHVNLDFLDVLDDSDSILGIMGAFEMGKGKIGGYVMGAWMQIGANAGPNNGIDITNEIALLEFGLSYQIGRWAMTHTASADHPARDLTLALTAGGRYTDLSLELDFRNLPSRSLSKSWVDPMVGAKVIVPLAQHWSLVGQGEVGGFGAASDFAWLAAGLISWDFYIKEFPSALQVGYLAVGDDYTTGSGRSRFEWDTVLHGLVFNFTMRF